MRTNIPASLRFALLLGLLGATPVIAFDAGGFAYTKSVQTDLHSEPRGLAPTSGRLGFHKRVKVDQVQGVWLHVSDGAASGWVFSGNLAATEPEEVKGTDGLPLTASQTTASAAARPLNDVANDYAARRSLGAARSDLDWLLDQCKRVTAEQVDAHLRDQKKGDYQ